jgi:calcineurin-like phosphoesterase family protein
MLNVSQPALAQTNSTTTTENEEPLVKVAILPDTQLLTSKGPDTQLLTSKGWKVFYEQTQYAVDWGADYVVHLGDIVENWNFSYEWDRADIAFKTLDRAGIPYGVLAGNHDMDDANTTGMGTTYTNGYEEYFPISRVKNNGVFQENYGRPNENHYDIIEKNGLKLLFIYASWNITPDELDWVEEIIKKHPDHYVIMVTHGNIDAYGQSVLATEYPTRNVSAEEKQQFFDNMERWRSMGDYDNVILQLSGHYDGSNAVDTGEVVMAMLDYQGIDFGPPDYNWTAFDPHSTHYMGLLTFYKDHIKYITYNPTIDDYIWSDDHIYNHAGVDMRPLFAGEEWEYSIKFKTPTNQTIYSNITKTITNANLPDFNFVAVGDWGCTSNTINTVNNIIQKNPELILALGDFSYNDTSADCWLDIIKPIDQKMKIAIGNHDDVTPFLLNQLMSHFALRKQYYSFNYENVHFTVLSTELPSEVEVDSEQYKFVKNDLANASSDPDIDWIVVYYHKPAYISPNQHTTYPQNATVSVPSEFSFRDLYHPLFDEYGIDLVLQGHQHAYERTYPITYNWTNMFLNSSKPIITDTNTTYYRNTEGEIFATVGTGGQGIYDFVGKDPYIIAQYEWFGFLNVNVINNDNNNGTTLNIKYYTDDGTIKDRFTITKGVNNLQKGSEIRHHSNNMKPDLH